MDIDQYKRINPIRVLFVTYDYGQPYCMINKGIIKALQLLSHEVNVISCFEDVVSHCIQMKPDLVIVLQGDLFPIQQVHSITSMNLKIALWLTDDPYFFDTTSMYANAYDIIFTNDSGSISFYEKTGCKHVYHLPLGVNTDDFYPMEVPSNYHVDLCFIGVAWNNRLTFFESIAKDLVEMNILIIGPGWENLPSYKLLQTKIHPIKITFSETIQYVNGAKIIVNHHRAASDDTYFKMNRNRIPANSVNPRTFEFSACQAFQLTDIREDLSKHYELNKEIATYNTPEEFIQKAHYYINNEEDRKKIAQQGFIRTCNEHTYEQRIYKMLELTTNCILDTKTK